MKYDTNSFVHELIKQVPELDGIYINHLEDYGQLLPHVFMGDVTRFVTEIAEIPNNRNLLGKIIRILEQAFKYGSDEIKELISVSFLENLDQSQIETFNFIEAFFGEELRNEMQCYKSICL